MRVVFMGSAELACPSLEALIDEPSIDLLAAVTQPDRPKGRGRKLAPCFTRALADARGVPVMTPVKVNAPESIEALKDLEPDFIAVVAYGQILRSELLNIPRLGCINIHGSLLPAYRGAAPIQWAVASGDRVTGVTSMYMNEGMDEGDMIDRVEVDIRPDDTAGTVHDKLAQEGGQLLVSTLKSVWDGTAVRTVQDDALATYAPKLSKADGEIDWNMPAEEICNRVRGFNPWPVCWTRRPEKGVIKVWRAAVEDRSGAPGEVLDLKGDGPLIAAGDKSIRLIDVQPEGGKMMSGSEFLRGHSW